MTTTLWRLMRDPVVVLGLPLAGLAVVAVYVLVETARPGTFTEGPSRTMSEAVARGNAGHALEMMAEGGDIDAVAPVPAGVIDGSEYHVTPLEAAILTRRIESVGLLLASGANPYSTPRDVVCLAKMRLPDALVLFGAPPGDPEAAPAPVPDALEACVRTSE